MMFESSVQRAVRAGLPLLSCWRQISQVASAFEIDLRCLDNLSDRWHEAVMALDVVIRHTIGMTPSMITLEVCMTQRLVSLRPKALVPLLCRALPLLIPDALWRIQAKIFPPQRGCPQIGGSAEAWSGYHQSLRPAQAGLTLSMESATASFIGHMSLVEYFCRELRMQGPLDLRHLPRQDVRRLPSPSSALVACMCTARDG
jgi:hypothetical protein